MSNVVGYAYGSRVDSRTAAMLAEAERRSRCPIVVTQGSYSHGSLSAGTHAGGGAADIRVWNQKSPAAVDHLELWLRRVGFAAYYRTKNQGPWEPHIHAIAIGCPDLSPAARDQVDDYYAGRNGLANNGTDLGPRLDPIPTWEDYQAGETLPDTGGDPMQIFGNTKLARWVETRVANGVANAAQRSTTFRQELREIVSTIEVENRVDGKSYPLPVAMSSSWYYGFLAGVDAVKGDVPERFKTAATELDGDE